MEMWKRNLIILFVGQFLVNASMSTVTPFLPLYLQQLGMKDPEEVRLWTSLIFGANLLTAFLFSPVWGKLADRYGCKIMLIRSGFSMALIITLMGFATDHLQLLLLRLFNGMLAGFIPAAIALAATNTPKEKTGYALGILHSGSVAGTICGPLLGGWMADAFGMSAVFSYTGLSIFLATLIVIFGVKEHFEMRKGQVKTSLIEDFRIIISKKPIPALYFSGFMIRFSMVGTLPLIPLYVQELVPSHQNLAFLAGLTTATLGIANMISAPKLGRLGDRLGSHYILIFTVAGAILFSIPQAFIQHLWQFILLRFCTGLCLGGMTPSLHVLLRHHAPEGMESRTYSYSNSALFLGGMSGSIVMGVTASAFGLPMIFLGSAFLLFLNHLWMRWTILPQIPDQQKGKTA